jgi:hypothetical protein
LKDPGESQGNGQQQYQKALVLKSAHDVSLSFFHLSRDSLFRTTGIPLTS